QQNPVRALLYLLPIGLVYYVASLVLTTGTIRIISDSYLGREPRLRDALSLGWSKIWPLTAVGFGKAIVIMLIVLGCGVAVGIGLTAVGYVAPLALAPVLAAVITLMYYDLRVRREAFDLQVLGQRLGII